MTTILEALKDAAGPQPPDPAWRCGDVTIKHDHLRLLIEAAEALDHFAGYGCPVCHGDCASANPPVYGCPAQQAEAVLSKLKAPLP